DHRLARGFVPLKLLSPCLLGAPQAHPPARAPHALRPLAPFPPLGAPEPVPDLELLPVEKLAHRGRSLVEDGFDAVAADARLGVAAHLGEGPSLADEGDGDHLPVEGLALDECGTRRTLERGR